MWTKGFFGNMEWSPRLKIFRVLIHKFFRVVTLWIQNLPVHDTRFASVASLFVAVKALTELWIIDRTFMHGLQLLPPPLCPLPQFLSLGEGMVLYEGGVQCVNRNSISFVRRMEAHPCNPMRHWTSLNEATLCGHLSRRSYERIVNLFHLRR